MSEREHRKPREFFTRALTQICEKLDKQDTYEIHWKDRYLHRQCSGLLRAESLWVVGSYARGALTCGDLDLVLKLVRVEGIGGGVSRFVATAFRRAQGVRFYEGDPNVNSSGVTFPEAVQVWLPNGNWRSMIESIAINPNATRFSRPTDEFPLRVEQVYDEVEDIEALIKRRHANEIVWRLLPINPEGSSHLSSEDWEDRVLRYMSRNGKDTKKLLPHLLDYLRTHATQFHTRFSHCSNPTELHIEGTFIGLGRPRLNDELLDTAEVSRVVLFPHLSRRGPNGILELRRGTDHPMEGRARNLSVYALQTEDGTLMRECNIGQLGGECERIDLFATIQNAQEYAADIQEDHDSELLPILLTGTALLETFSYADAIDIHKANGGIHTLALTHMGRVVIGEDGDAIEVASVTDVFEILTELSHRS